MNGPKALRTTTRKLIASGDYLTACDVIRENLGASAFGDLVREEFLDPKFLPAEIHRHVEQIDSPQQTCPPAGYKVYHLNQLRLSNVLGQK